MPRPGPRMANTAVRLPAALTDDLDRIAAALDVNRSEVIRDLLTAAVKQGTRESARGEPT